MAVDGLVIEGEYQFFAFQGQAGERVQIEVVGDTGFDPVLAVLDPNGEIILEADDNTNSLNPSVMMTLPENGTYQIRVNGYLSSGIFRATVAILYD